ncbi:MAG: 30S ribosomal protein S6, partial [Clostridiales bacterium]|nr:30S ribosomal protein S6 [Clostridiales bacterium]
MNKYESIYIIRPTVEEEGSKALIERFSNLIQQEGGQIENVDEWGKRRLAYPID